MRGLFPTAKQSLGSRSAGGNPTGQPRLLRWSKSEEAESPLPEAFVPELLSSTVPPPWNFERCLPKSKTCSPNIPMPTSLLWRLPIGN